MRSAFFTLLTVLPCLALAACSGLEMKPGDQARNAREIREGPGLLTGSDGEFVIFRVEEEAATEENAEENGEWKDLEEPKAVDSGNEDASSVE